MEKFLVRYTHVEETTYEQWIEAKDEEEAFESIDEKADFSNVVRSQGIELKDREVVRKGE